jgi:L-ribulose-5-phosphate 3-epimerase
MLRREFLAAAAAVPAAASATKLRPTVAVFSKPLQKLGCDELGRAIRRCGLRHVDLTVRPGGHVLPERVREDLPRAVQALDAQGVGTAMITTAITSASDPTARPILSEAARLKIPLYKLGYWRYRDNDIEETLLRVKRDVTGLVALGKEVGIEAAWHNHSGDYVGLAIWDTREIIRDLDPKWIGYYFDLSHATAEGGVAGWQIGLRLALPRLKIVAVKDHLWEKVQGTWRRRTCPLGEGMVDFPRAFSMLARAGFKGLISLHIEYDTPDPPSAIARDAAFLNQQIQRAYGG